MPINLYDDDDDGIIACFRHLRRHLRCPPERLSFGTRQK